MKKINIKHIDPSIWAIIISLFIVFYLNFSYSNWNKTEKVVLHDVLSYYAYLPAAFIYNDLSLEFIKEGGDKLGKHFWGKKSPTGKTVIITSYGMSALYFPFFIIADSMASLMGYPADGYSKPYCFALVMSSIFYLLIGIVFLRKFLLKYFSNLVVAITLIITVLTTNMLWYVTSEATMSHVYSFALLTIFIYFIDLWLEKPSVKYTIIIGLLTGIISLIRPTNIIVVLMLVLWKITSIEDLKQRLLFFIKKWNLILLMILLAIVVWIPQFIYWKFISGSFLFYSYPDSMGFFFSNPQIFNVLFSWRKGFFIYTPVMIFAFIGIGIMYKHKKEFFWSVLIYSLLSIYIISSWWDWWYGGSFGLRPLIDSYGIFAIGLATFLTWVLKASRIKMIVILTLVFITAALSTWHYKRYYRGSIHWVAMTKEAYFDSFWRTYPSGTFYGKLRQPDYKLAKKGIYKYEDENFKLPEEK